MQRSTHFDMLERLERGIRELTTSDRWAEFLRVQATFRQYSHRNALLIAQQCPHAEYVAGFGAWRRLGRSVRRGERAIWILAPTGNRISGTDEEQARPVRFVSVPVFDISQTEGLALPEICSRLNEQHGDDAYIHLSKIAVELGFTPTLVELDHGVNGECNFTTRAIGIERRNGSAQRVKSLAHELAHALLHEHATDRSRAELEAESAAYVICQLLGIDSGQYSFGYVASWIGDGSKAVEAIHRSCDEITRVVNEVMMRYERLARSTCDVA